MQVGHKYISRDLITVEMRKLIARWARSYTIVYCTFAKEHEYGETDLQNPEKSAMFVPKLW